MSPTKVRPTGETQFGFHQLQSGPQNTPSLPHSNAIAGLQNTAHFPPTAKLSHHASSEFSAPKITPSTTKSAQQDERRVASEKAIPIGVPNPTPIPAADHGQQVDKCQQQNASAPFSQVGSVPFTGSSQHNEGFCGSSAYDVYESDGSYCSQQGVFPSSFRNSNYPLGLLTTTAEDSNATKANNINDSTSFMPLNTNGNSYDPAPALSRMKFETGSYDTCAEYLTRSAMTRHSENFYQHRKSGKSSSNSPSLHALNNTPYSTHHYDSNLASPSTSSLSRMQQHGNYATRHNDYHGNASGVEVHNMSMELTFENSTMSFGLAGAVPTSSADFSGANRSADQMDEFEPFEFLTHDSSMSHRQSAASNNNKDQSVPRFGIPLL